MKKIILALAVLTLMSNTAIAQDDEPELMDAPTEYIMSVLAQCKEDAVEDEIASAEMASYLLTCVNDELEASYYKPITVLPKAG